MRYLMRWETDTRYVQAQLQQDLLGDWIVMIANGGRFNKRGRLRTVAVADKTAGEFLLACLHKRRLSRGYALVLR